MIEDCQYMGKNSEENDKSVAALDHDVAATSIFDVDVALPITA